MVIFWASVSACSRSAGNFSPVSSYALSKPPRNRMVVSNMLHKNEGELRFHTFFVYSHQPDSVASVRDREINGAHVVNSFLHKLL